MAINSNKGDNMVRLESAKTYNEWFYFGRTIPYNQYLEEKAIVEKGGCPFCNRTGLTPRYGSQAKHIRSHQTKGE